MFRPSSGRSCRDRTDRPRGPAMPELGWSELARISDHPCPRTRDIVRHAKRSALDPSVGAAKSTLSDRPQSVDCLLRIHLQAAGSARLDHGGPTFRLPIYEPAGVSNRRSVHHEPLTKKSPIGPGKRNIRTGGRLSNDRCVDGEQLAANPAIPLPNPDIRLAVVD
jgi:hypothetical protein